MNCSLHCQKAGSFATFPLKERERERQSLGGESASVAAGGGSMCRAAPWPPHDWMTGAVFPCHVTDPEIKGQQCAPLRIFHIHLEKNKTDYGRFTS